MKSNFTLILLSALTHFSLKAQTSFEWNLFTDVELTKAGDLSHYFYNEIHRSTVDWQVDLAQFNALGKLKFSDRVELNSQIVVYRKMGKRMGLFNELELYQVKFNQLNLRWAAKEKPIALKLGRFLNPFGQFYKNQIPGQRTIIHTPLAYSYTTNISRWFGFVNNLGEGFRPRVDDYADWGLPTLHYLGYSTGLYGIWGKPERTSIELAIVNGAPNLNELSLDPLQMGVIARFGFRPNYFSKFGISLSHGTFMDNVANNGLARPLDQYRQSIIGTDFEIGWSFFELTGEIILTAYKVPTFDSGENLFRVDDSSLLWSRSFYLDLKYEMPFLPGSFLAYRIDHLGFGKDPSTFNNDNNWDDRIWRHVIGMQYDLSEWLAIKGGISTQTVKNRSWDQSQRTFRLMLSLKL